MVRLIIAIIKVTLNIILNNGFKFLNSRCLNSKGKNSKFSVPNIRWRIRFFLI